MQTEKFKIIQFIREYLLMIDKQMDNFPKKDIELKNITEKKYYKFGNKLDDIIKFVSK